MKKGHDRRSRSPEYSTWCCLRSRCNNPKNTRYKNYGGRGIKVCDRWSSFENFYADMGARPPGLTLDRINNDGDYEPENCRWATRAVQANNRRTSHNSRLIHYQGESLYIGDWAKRLGISRLVLAYRLNKCGWSVERALSTKWR